MIKLCWYIDTWSICILLYPLYDSNSIFINGILNQSSSSQDWTSLHSHLESVAWLYHLQQLVLVVLVVSFFIAIFFIPISKKYKKYIYQDVPVSVLTEEKELFG